VTPAVWATIAIALVLAAAASFGALRLGTRRMGSIAVAALFMLAALLGIVAILSVTFFRKTTSA
jgi:hypothetical protein